MLKERLAAAFAVKDTLLPAERAQDKAAIFTTRCLLAALEGRASANLGIDTGLEAIGYLNAAASKAIEARELMVRAHAELATIPSRIGLEPFGWGPTRECPEPGFTEASDKIVPIAAAA